MLYHIQQKQLSVSLVSPLAVLNVKDDLTIFEMKEVSLIYDSLKKTDETFGTDSFNKNFRNNFLKEFSTNKEMTEFVLDNLIWNGVIMKDRHGFDSDAFYKNILYPAKGMKMSSGKLIFSRAKIGKTFYLNAMNAENINFPVGFKFEFERKYIISKINGKFYVEVM